MLIKNIGIANMLLGTAGMYGGVSTVRRPAALEQRHALDALLVSGLSAAAAFVHLCHREYERNCSPVDNAFLTLGCSSSAASSAAC